MVDLAVILSGFSDAFTLMTCLQNPTTNPTASPTNTTTEPEAEANLAVAAAPSLSMLSWGIFSLFAVFAFALVE